MNAKQAATVMTSDNKIEVLQVLQAVNREKAMQNLVAIFQGKAAGDLQVRAYNSFNVKDELNARGFRFDEDFNGGYWYAYIGQANFTNLPDGPDYQIVRN